MKPEKKDADGITRLTRIIEAAIVAAFFVFVLSARLYFWLLHKTEKLRWRVM